MDYEISTAWKENFSVYSENLSIYYIISIVVSFLSVIFTWWYHKFTLQQSINDEIDFNNHLENDKDMDDDDDKGTTDSLDMNSEVLNHLKMSRQSAIVQQISASLTEEQIEEEKEAEAQQLAAIYQLLREQEDKFQVSSMEELQDQMKLYR